jgi:tRNA-2-methylthio-N6-dimethylallyladenosine synthase
MSLRNHDLEPEISEITTTRDRVTDLPATNSNRKYHIWTIGCQMNVADSNHVAAELEKIGFNPTENVDEADVVVLNTCVVRQSAENKGVGKAGSLKPWKESRPGRTLALMGCMVGVKPSPKLIEGFPHVDVFMAPSEASPLIGHLREAEIAAEVSHIEREQLLRRYQVQDEIQPVGTVQSIKHLALSGEVPVAAHVPIVYGCSHACTFCIIPFRRGVERSRPMDEIVNEIKGLVAQGVREVTLLGQIVDRYGYDWMENGRGNSATVAPYLGARGEEPGANPGNSDHALRTTHYDLADLLRAVHAIDGLWRIRFLTSHPNYMTDRILEAVRDLPKVCPHIEVPVQAGNDEVLDQMKRGYTNADYRALVGRIREVIPDVAINTDIIVGFCGETAEQFEDTYQLLADLKLDKTHLARYSPRPGTVSERRMIDDVPEADKVRRHQTLEELQEIVCAEINARLLGESVEVLVEGEHKGKWRGRTPQNKLVFVESDLDLRGRLIEAQITWTGPWSMQGRFVRNISPTGERIEIPKMTYSDVIPLVGD